MLKNNAVYEITKKMQNKQVLESDIKEAFALVSNLFKNKYINVLETEMKNHINLAKSTPSKEIALLSAIKPFTTNSNHKSIDNFIDVMTNFSAINTLLPTTAPTKISNKSNNKFFSINSLQKDSSIKNDGVYDLDESCFSSISTSKNNSSPIMLFIILMLLNKN